jgi:hypothetical protein
MIVALEISFVSGERRRPALSAFCAGFVRARGSVLGRALLPGLVAGGLASPGFVDAGFDFPRRRSPFDGRVWAAARVARRVEGPDA